MIWMFIGVVWVIISFIWLFKNLGVKYPKKKTRLRVCTEYVISAPVLLIASIYGWITNYKR